MLTDEQLDVIEMNADNDPSPQQIRELCANARLANRYRRDHEAMKVIREAKGMAVPLRYAPRYDAWECAGEYASDPADALLAWREKYGQETER